MILDEIIAHKRQEVALARQRTPLREVEEQALRQAPARGFARAIRRLNKEKGNEGDSGCGGAGGGGGACSDGGGSGKETPGRIRVIAEIKKASPSKGVIRADFRPEDFARSYEAHGAAAISVLTDEIFFQGGLDILRRVRGQVALPLLRKEFIFDPYQIAEARAAGADGILLIAGVLDAKTLRDFRERAEAMGMDCLVEIHTQDEARLAVDSGARIVGVNNRDLKTFKSDLRQTERMLPFLPKDAIVVSESGIAGAGDVRYLASLGIDAILVGETLMRHDDPGKGLASLLSYWPLRC
ncbi:MAG: indole-3-glycerol phosphate synthase TrpC [Candidatus Sumerlaeota bacterium]|nr:indole-3-glycerol phosphate synthase TrpC [Candidatus Sumerlaeota bacterium]